jgi:hypothetical protein
MSRLRSLVVVTAAATLTFTGLSSASADERGRGHGVRADIVSISDDAKVNDRGRIRVEATYECWGKARDITTTVTLTQRSSGARYDAEVTGGLDCDGDEHTQVVRLDKDGRDRVRNGDAKVTWEYSTDHKRLDKEREGVDVRGAGKGHR